jgi:2-methylcitrate dehydratase PrpD
VKTIHGGPPEAVPGVDASIGATQRLAAYVAGISVQALPEAAREAARKLLLDGIGCMLAGTQGGPARSAAAMSAGLGGSGGPSTILISGSPATARDAAFVNGITLYSVGVNDIHKASCSHPGGCVIPALLAVGEWQATPGGDMLAAMVAGYDVMGRLGRATMPSHRDRGFHPTGTYGAFAATATVGRLLKLDPATLASAFGVAGSQAAGLVCFQTDGALTMVFHAGRAAQNGVEACLLARAGLNGPVRVFEDPHGGFLHTTCDAPRTDEMTGGLGQFFEVQDTTFRPFYGCTYTIAASSATAEVLQRRQRAADDVVQVTVRCHPVVQEEVDDDDPRTLLAARISMQFNVALVLARGDVFVGDVQDRDLWDSRLRSFFPKIRFELDESMSPWASAVTVRFADGETESVEVLKPKGDPANPMTWVDTETKFRRLVESSGGARHLDEVVNAVRHLEQTDGRSLMNAINAAARTMRVGGRGD